MASSNRINEDTLRKSIKALLKWKKLQLEEATHDDDGDDDDFMYLLLTLKKIPPKQDIPHRINLPHPLQSQPNICLIVADGPKNSTQKRLTIEVVQKMLKSQDIPVSKVVKLSKLKSAEFNCFEAKRKLYDSFDLFLADKRIIHLLPKLLGKQFYKKKRKVPVSVDLKNITTSWKEEFEKACSSSLLCFGSGTCSVIRIGRWGLMETDQIVDNVLAAVNAIVEVVPKKWSGVRAFHLKFSESLALPIYETKQKKDDQDSK